MLESNDKWIEAGPTKEEVLIALEKSRQQYIKEAQMGENGTKYDQDKPRTDLIPALAILEVAKVMGFGANKYAAFNWLGGLRCCRLVAAALRHLFQWLGGESNDKETGLSHLAHAACGVLMALETYMRKPELDDRYKEIKSTRVAEEKQCSDCVECKCGL